MQRTENATNPVGNGTGQDHGTNGGAGRWQFWIDRGGTFTDVVARHPDGHISTSKLLSENPELYDDAAVEGVRRTLGIAGQGPIDSGLVEAVKMGTTVATNALLERKGEPLLLVVTRGFRDALRIAYQNRPKLFERQIVLPEMLYRQVIEVSERVDAQGQVLTPLDHSAAQRDLQAAFDGGLRAVAIVLMHGYRAPEHEKALAAMAREIGFTQISVSHDISPLIRFVPRGDTTVVDAYLSPVLRRYVDRVAASMPGVRLQFMQSNGGLTDALAFQGKDSILSGPAGGIVGMARVSKAAGFDRVIGFDMGGTSTDVSHFAGEFERELDTQVAGVRMRSPMMSIHTVAAGGGSILHFDGARMRAGPDSAGANPGPACYRRGGPLTVTDANVMLGRLQPHFFPPVFGPNGDEELDVQTVRDHFATLAQQITEATGRSMSPEAVAEGFLQIAVTNMANAIKKISVQRGYDITTYTLTTFGGAGGQHACAVADALAMPRVLAHPYAGVLSAYGMGLAEPTAMRERSIESKLDADGIRHAQDVLEQLEQAARDELQAQGEVAETLRSRLGVLLRYQGTDTSLPVRWASLQEMQQEFERLYRQRFAFLLPGRALIIESAVVEVIGTAPGGTDEAGAATGQGGPVVEATAGAVAHPVGKVSLQQPSPADQVRMYADGQWHDTPLYLREVLQAGHVLAGPAIIVESTATTVLEPGWRATMTDRGDLVLDRAQPRPRRTALGTDADPIMLEIFNNLFMSIAEQMGYRLQNTAHSVNIKERLDFSCAIFDAQGQLVANAPHMPVHLGSMGASVQAVMQRHPVPAATSIANGTQAAEAALVAAKASTAAGDPVVGVPLAPGDVYVLNDPYAGGTHLPDVTVITPVFDEQGANVLFYVGSRGHHADIGGITPGSMPPDSRTIDEEGVLATDFHLVSDGVFREDDLRALLSGARYPARNPEQNIADLRAQIAANEKGREELLRMVRHFGLDVVSAYMRHVQDNAEESVRRVIGALSDGSFELLLDNGARICARITVDRAQRSAAIDFSGTSTQLGNNFNAPLAVTTAAVLYVFRTLVDDEIPMNAGCLKPIALSVPSGSMLNPSYPGAVVAGNVETSMCVTNCLYGALGVMAGGPPTMNNFTFGNERYQYYETISGGSGAGGVFDADGKLVGGFDGTSVVQTHMTNSRLTDPEVFEARFPVLLESYEIRPGSGGEGRWHGGDGGVRRVRFLQPMTASILSNGRIHPAFGARGGKPGTPGRNRVERADGRVEELAHADRAELQAGDVFVVETPGGGGFGPA